MAIEICWLALPVSRAHEGGGREKNDGEMKCRVGERQQEQSVQSTYYGRMPSCATPFWVWIWTRRNEEQLRRRWGKLKIQKCCYRSSPYLHSLSGINPERRAQARGRRRGRLGRGRRRRRQRAVLRPHHRRPRHGHVAPRLGGGDVLRGGGRHHRRVLQVHLHPLGQGVDLRRRG